MIWYNFSWDPAPWGGGEFHAVLIPARDADHATERAKQLAGRR